MLLPSFLQIVFLYTQTFASFLLELATTSFMALVHLPEIAEFVDWPAARLRSRGVQFLGFMFMV